MFLHYLNKYTLLTKLVNHNYVMFNDSVFTFISYTKKQTKCKNECYNYNII